MRIVALSDTHCRLNYITIPNGDILVFAGDLTFRGSHHEIQNELDKLAKHRDRFQEMVFICGNHDWLGEKEPALMRQMCNDRGITYLDNEEVVFNNIKFFGSAYTPWFYDWAFNAHRGIEISRHWNKIPLDTNILITHGPPMGILDRLPNGMNVGCDDLRKRIDDLKDLKVHIFGHIHHSYGEEHLDGVKYYNVSSCSEQYTPINLPVVIEI